ncbi:MAG: hypothetical protein ACRD2A_15155 [Vicinamibacterales bacterium]
MNAADTASELCTTLVTLLNLLHSKCRSGSFSCCVVGRGQAAKKHLVPAGNRLNFLPPWLLREFEYDPVDDIRFTATTTDGSADDKQLRDCGALFTQILVEPDNRAVACDRLRNFSVTPAIIIDASSDLTAVWPLETTLRLDNATDRERAEQLQRGLAAAVGGRTDNVQAVIPRASVGATGNRQHATEYLTLPAWSPSWAAIRLPGSRNHEIGGRLVTLARFTEQRVTADAIEQALDIYTQQERT